MPILPVASANMLVLGHRGAISDHFDFHQNSLRAFQEALASGDGFETDACVDQDGEIFLIHEAKFVDPAKGVEYCAAEHLDPQSAAFMGERRIAEMTTEEMRRLRLKDGSPIPTLERALELVGAYPGKLLDIELKAYEVVEPVLSTVKKALNGGILKPEAVMISSFNHPALEIVRRVAPEVLLGAIFNYSDIPATPLFPWQPESSGAYLPFDSETLNSLLLQQVHPDYIIIPQELLTETNVMLVAKYHPRAKIAAWVFTERQNFDLSELLGRLRSLKATQKVGIMMVDNPHEFKTASHERA